MKLKLSLLYVLILSIIAGPVAIGDWGIPDQYKINFTQLTEPQRPDVDCSDLDLLDNWLCTVRKTKCERITAVNRHLL